MVIPSLTVLWILNNIFSSDCTLKADLDPLYAAEEKPTALVSLAWDRRSSHQAEENIQQTISTECGKHETQTVKTDLFVVT